MNIHYKILLLLTLIFGLYGCTYEESLISINRISDSSNKKREIIYKLSKTGFDNYDYDFIYIMDGDSIVFYNLKLNDATYKNIRINTTLISDTLFISSNWGLINKKRKGYSKIDFIVKYKELDNDK